MATLKGDVSILSFPDLLQALASRQKEGTLIIQRGPNSKTLHISPKGMRLLCGSTRKVGLLGEILIRTRKITRTQLDQLLIEQRQTGKRLGELVGRDGVVTKKDIAQALREQAQEEIYDLFTWDDATFEFQEGPPPSAPPESPLSEIVISESPTSIMLEAARRYDELTVIMRVIQDEDMIPIRTTKPFAPEKLGLAPDLLISVYNQVNARNSVREVIHHSLYPRFDALRGLYQLVIKGCVTILDREGATAAHLRTSSARIRTIKSMAPVPAKPKVPGITQPKRSILLLGDMLKFRQALAMILREAGYEVLEDVAAQAMNLLSTQNRRIHALILDVGLLSADESQFVAWLCENTRVPVVVLSDNATKTAAQEAIQSGVKAYIVKPFTRDSILQVISKLCPPAQAAAPAP